MPILQEQTAPSDDLPATLWVSGKQQDRDTLRKALSFAAEHHNSSDSSPYSLEVARILSTLNVDQNTLIASILSDTKFIDILDKDTLQREYSPAIASIVESVRWLNTFRNCDNEDQQPTVPQQAEKLRRMLFAMIKDVRAVLIKLAWRLHRLRSLKTASAEIQKCVARETLDLFSPLANRLGVNQLKWELEDLSFRFLDPYTYKTIAKALNLKRIEREQYIANFVEALKGVTNKLNIEAEIYGRPKHIYSIYRKMRRKNIDSVDELYDLRAVRIIVDNVTTCYALLGEIHQRWTPIPAEYDDYIANRKPNGYQSLHTVVYGPQGRTIEIQLRTHDMHAIAELGVAAHWQYKEGASQGDEMESTISALREMLLSNENNDNNLLEDFRAEFFTDRVFALTPKGEVIDLPRGATPLDFAYSIHTSVGHRCVGAKVNGKMVALTYALNNADQVKILTQKEERPKRSWLNNQLGYLRSSKARNSVRHWFRQQDHETNKRDGQALLEREVSRLGIDMPDIKKLVKHFRLQREPEFLIALGRGDIGVQQLQNVLLPRPQQPEEPEIREFIPPPETAKNEQSGIQVNGIDNLLVNIANCCKPVPGDDIAGYITIGRGVSIHRSNCPNIQRENLTEEQQSRLVEVSWGNEQRNYAVDIKITGLDRPGLLRDVTQVLAAENANIFDISISHEVNTLKATINITMQVEDTAHLEHVISKLDQLQSVIDIRR